MQLTDSSSNQAIYPSIHPFMHNLSANGNQSVYSTCLFISISNTHQSALFNTQSFRQNSEKIGPESEACVLCDSHIFHLTAESHEDKTQQSLEQKNSAIWPLVQVAHKNERQGACWKMHGFFKKTTISNWKSSTRSFRSAWVKGLRAQARTCLVSEEPGSHILNQHESTKEQNQVLMFVPQGWNMP